MSCEQDKYVSNNNKIAVANQTYVPYSTSCMTTDFENHKEKIMMALSWPYHGFRHHLDGLRQRSQKLQRLYGNLIVNDIYNVHNMAAFELQSNCCTLKFIEITACGRRYQQYHLHFWEHILKAPNQKAIISPFIPDTYSQERLTVATGLSL